MFAVVGIMVIIFRNRCKFCLPLFLAHIILLIPVLGYFEHPHYPVDRYSLLSSICLSIFIAFLLIRIINKKAGVIVSIGLIMVVTSLGWLSFKQVKVWNNSESLFKHMIKTLNGDPYVDDIHWRLGAYLYQKKRTDEATIHLKKTLKLRPGHLISHKLLGVISYEKGNFKNAKYHFQIALKINGSDPQAHYYLSQINHLTKKQKK